MMKKTVFLICLLLIMSAAILALAAPVEINLGVGESYLIPEGRRGSYTVSGEDIVRVRDNAIIALKPGRATVRVSGEKETEFSVLVLFTAEKTASADDTAPEAVQTEQALSSPVPSPSPAVPSASPAPISTPAPEPEPQAEEEDPSPDIPEPAADPTDPKYQYYDRASVPELINGAIDLAFTQWREDAAEGTKKFSRLGKYNKYSYWQCGSGSGCDIGWCGAFLGYVFDHAGVPMDAPNDSVPHEDGEPYSVHAAGVGKINTGFSKMERLTMVPRPGYLVIYGQQKGYGYKHIGLVTDVDELADGRFLIKTVEGNMSSTIRRYCYVFDSGEAVKNTAPCPEEYRCEDAGINAYEHVKNWNITTFCQTWY